MKKYFLMLLVLAGCTTPKDGTTPTPTDIPTTTVPQPPTTTLPPPAPPMPVTYNVYQGCAQPQIPTNTVTLDSALGEDFAAFVKAKKIQPGMHIILKGNHNGIGLNKYQTPQLVGMTSWIWIEGQGATMSPMNVGDFQNVIISGITFKGSGQLLQSSNFSNLIISGNTLMTVDDASAYGLTEWMAAANGISTRGGSCISILNNAVKNVRFGINAGSTEMLVEGNSVNNFSADAFRIVTSKVALKNNTATDSYMSKADGDANHDDGIQLFNVQDTTNGLLEDILIEGNTIVAATDLKRAHIGDLQGIGAFDSIQNRITIRGNTVSPYAYHAISLSGANDSLIEGNTVKCLIKAKLPWIGVFTSKTERAPAKTIVRNNTAPKFTIPAGVTGQNNIVNANCMN